MALSKIPADLITGGLSVDPAAPADAITVDSSGNVGVGTSSPLNRLTTRATANNYPGGNLSLESSGGANATYFAQTTGGDFFISNGGTADHFIMDSSGRIRMPYKPMFMAYPTTNYSGGSMPTGVIDMTVLYDNGTNFTAANDRFTAPVAGWYRTTWGGLQLPSTVTSLMINGTRTYNGNHVAGTLSYVTMTQTAIVELSAGDYLNIEGWNGGGYYNDWYLWTVEHIG